MSRSFSGIAGTLPPHDERGYPLAAPPSSTPVSFYDAFVLIARVASQPPFPTHATGGMC